VGCFSFFATKNMTTGEGGMLVARDSALLAKARALRSHCMTTTSWDKHNGRASTYDVVDLGFNYRPTDISSALGRIQLSKLVADQRRRLTLARLYHSLLKDCPEIERPFAGRTDNSAHHLFPILLPTGGPARHKFQHQLKSKGIQSSVHYPPIHLFSYYRNGYGHQPGSLPITEKVAAREVSLPMHSRLTEDQVSLVVKTIRQLWQR
jgi:dTDP-4-amino-4,6-dideoxygalactose transaminase